MYQIQPHRAKGEEGNPRPKKPDLNDGVVCRLCRVWAKSLLTPKIRELEARTFLEPADIQTLKNLRTDFNLAVNYGNNKVSLKVIRKHSPLLQNHLVRAVFPSLRQEDPFSFDA